MPYITKYTVRKSRLKNASLDGFLLDDNDKLMMTENLGRHYLFLPVFDSGIKEGKWGRFFFDMKLPEDSSIKIYLFASDEEKFIRKEVETGIDEFLRDGEVSSDIKIAFFEAAEALTYIDASDVLMYELTGRYLYAAIYIEGEGEGYLSNLKIYNPGDTFMNVFPEIYREWGGFFHRYLSVFSSVFNDFQDKIDNFGENLNPDKASVELLEVYAGWLGIDVSGNFLDEDTLRKLVKAAPELNRCKGTKKCLEKICEIMLSEKAIIVEKKAAKDEDCYGKNVFDVTILVRTYVDEKRKAQVSFVLKQFVPIRANLRIIYFAERSELDQYSYLDMNAKIFSSGEAALDDNMMLDGNLVLSE